MKKFILVLVLVIVYNGINAQIDESSFSYNYSEITTYNDPSLDTAMIYGKLNIEFDLEDTLSFKGVQIQLTDSQGNTVSNEVYLKGQLLANGNYSMPTVSLSLGFKSVSENYIIWLSYLHINSIEYPVVSKNITYE